MQTSAKCPPVIPVPPLSGQRERYKSYRSRIWGGDQKERELAHQQQTQKLTFERDSQDPPTVFEATRRAVYKVASKSRVACRQDSPRSTVWLVGRQ